jgi:UDP-GlcNAc:undecaprenyl-phosphate/decaprenyl-phosphate GlcNAc-1-phosphate transferase
MSQDTFGNPPQAVVYWKAYLGIAVLSLILSLVFTPLFRSLAFKLGVLDYPGEARKIHGRPIPYLGGLAFYTSFLAAALAVRIFTPALADTALLPAAALGTVAVMMGIWDDARGLPGWFKLLVQLGLGAAFYFWGLRNADPFSMIGPATDWPWVGVSVTALWVAGVMNAVNFSDGMDGLATGIVAIIAAALFVVGIRNGHVSACVVMAALVGMTVGFLRYNFHPASIFMGDAGALFLGFVLAASTLATQQKGAAIIALAVPMTALAVPVADTALSFGRRLGRARGGGFFRPDREHLHHRLLALGMGQRKAVLTLYGVTFAMGVLSCMMDMVPERARFVLLVVAGGLILTGVLGLRIAERRRPTGD